MPGAPSAAPVPAPSRIMLLSAFLGTVVLFGLNFVAVRFSNAELPPLWGSGARFAIATVLLAAIVRVRGIPFPRGRALTGAFWYGVTSFALTYALIYYGLVSATAGAASVLFATVPLNTLLIAMLIGQERFRWAGLLGTVLVVVGVGVAFLGRFGDVSPLAYAAVYGAAVSAAVSGIVIRHFPRSHPLATNAVAMGVGAVLLLAASAAIGEPWSVPMRHDVQAAFVWLIASSIAVFSLVVWLLARWSATAVSYSGVLAPFVAVGAGAVLADEVVAPRFLGGAAIVLFGVWVGALWKGRFRRRGTDEAAAPAGGPPPR